MKQVICESPVIIRNSHLKRLLLSNGCYHTPAGYVRISEAEKFVYYHNFPKHRFSPKKLGVTHDNLNEFFVFDDETGVVYPMFIEVPCGHCACCRDKKCREWEFRAVAESVSSSNSTYFITLTYAPKYFPHYGVTKSAIQLFMKRLRIKLDRLGIEHCIKYFACGEYGTRTKRPHYHLLLWNFPDNNKQHFPNVTSVLHFIEECWSVYSRDDDGNWLYEKGSNTPLREPIGFCMCKPCDKGAYSYVMKYMRKQYKAPKGMNDVFYLVSKGIGSSHAGMYEKFYREYPEHLEISVLDTLSGQVVTTPLPSYYVNKYFPSVSKLIPKSIRDAYDSLIDLINQRYTVVSCYGFGNDTLEAYPYYTPQDKQVVELYQKLMYEHEYKPVVDYATEHRIYKLSYSEVSSLYYDITLQIDSYVNVLLAAYKELDTELLKVIPELKRRRNDSIDRWNENREPIDIAARVDKLNRNLVKSSYSEVL